MKPTLRLGSILAVLAVLALAGTATAQQTEDLTEDFESFNVSEKPDRVWYNYVEGDDVGAVNDSFLVVTDNKSMVFQGDETDSPAERFGTFRFGQPTQVSALEFRIQGEPVSSDPDGSQQVVKVQSTAPVRTMVEYYLFCTDNNNTDACELRVRFDHVDSTGQTLVNTTVNNTEFNIRMEINWVNSEYRLFVNSVDDGVFPFMEIPENLGRVRVNQHRGDIPLSMGFDDLLLEDGINASATEEQGDVATGLRNFAQDIRFDSGFSQWFLGFLFFGTVIAAVLVPLIMLGEDNTTVVGMSFYASLAALWIVFLEFWPSWITVAMIILAGVAVAILIRRVALGVRDASTGTSMVLGSLGYFIIAASLLAFAGFGTDTISLPTDPAEDTEDDSSSEQTFQAAVVECIVTGGAFFPYGLVGDCSQSTTTDTFQSITDAAGNVYGWVRASLQFLYQLLTFRFPIPTLFNVMLVGPPAAALAALAVRVIRG